MGVESAAASLIVLTVAGFTATNLDNLLVLVALSAGGARARAMLGFLLAAATLLAVATLGIVLGDMLDPGWVGYLGVVPVVLGLYLFLQLLRSPAPTAQMSAAAPVGVAGSFLVMLSNSGDNLALFLPLMADTRKSLLPIIILTYVGMAVAWTLLARWLVGHRLLAKSLERHGRWLLPSIMIAVGTVVLMDMGYDRLPG